MATTDGKPTLYVGGPDGVLTFEPPGPVVFGRGDDADVRLPSRSVSRRHAVATFEPGEGWVLQDEGGAAGTHIGQHRVNRQVVDAGLVVRLGDEATGVELHLETLAPGFARPVGRVTRIGRDPGNDLVIDDPLVSRSHAELRSVGGAHVLVDLGSQNGTFVDGRKVVEKVLQPGARVTIGSTSFELVRGSLRPRRVDAPVLRARHLAVDVAEGRRILDDVSIEVRPGELIAVVGPTGSGKSTLVKVLTGALPPDDGEVAVSGSDLYGALEELRRRFGYVPQDDILHTQLTVRRALDFGAALRFPIDTTQQERAARVEEVLAELGLSERADVPIEKLSGGQRKRTSVALELLTRPELLFLDEPTSGLDPGFEKAVMRLLRDLATGNRAVVVVTHSVASLHLCDRILFLATGGTVEFYGSPNEARDHFNGADLADVFDDLGRPRPRAEKRAGVRITATAIAPPPPVNLREWRAHTLTLMRRQVAVWTADRQNFAFLAAEMLVPALLILVLLQPGALHAGSAATGGRTLLASIVVSAAAIGAANALREIVKEVPLYLRERAAGVSRIAYLTAKAVSIGALTCVQVAILVLIATARARGPSAANLLVSPRLELVVDVAAAALCAVALGLLISALVSTSEKAMALIAVVFVVEWLFCGVAIDLSTKPVLQPAAFATSASWGMAAAASSADLFGLEGSCGARPPVQPAAPSAGQQSAPTPSAATPQTATPAASTLSCDGLWRAGVGRWLLSLSALVVLTSATLLGVALALRRKEPNVTGRAGGRRRPLLARSST